MTTLEFIAEAAEWRDTLEKAIGVLDATAFKIGLTFEPSHDFRSIAIPPGSALNPRYDAETSRLTERNAVWIGGDENGRWATRQALRIYNWYSGATLASESRALRVYYDHDDDARHTDYAIYDHPIADRIRGRVAFNGAVWVSPDLRGPRPELNGVHVAQIISPLSRFIAAYLYDVDWCIATAPAGHKKAGITDRYGWAGVVPGLRENIGGMSTENDCWLMWSRREDILAEAERIATHGLRAQDDILSDAEKVID